MRLNAAGWRLAPSFLLLIFPLNGQPQSLPEPRWIPDSLHASVIVDGYYSYNANRPSASANGQQNDLYTFNDKTDQFNLSMLELSAGQDPKPIGWHADLLFGRANTLIQGSSQQPAADYLKQAYLSIKPARARGAEIDLGQFVTFAGAEVIEAKDNWNYSRSLLFTWAVPLFHFGLRANVPVRKSWTVGVQAVNGWNTVTADNGGVTWGFTSSYVNPRYTWSLDFYTGPQRQDGQKSYRNLIDSTVLFTPTVRFSAYINYDYAQNRGSEVPGGAPARSPDWQGIAVAGREQIDSRSAVAGRYEYFQDGQGFATGTAQNLNEFTATYEYKWTSAILSRVEYRRDDSDVDFFHKGNGERVHAQSTATVALIACFGLRK